MLIIKSVRCSSFFVKLISNRLQGAKILHETWFHVTMSIQKRIDLRDAYESSIKIQTYISITLATV